MVAGKVFLISHKMCSKDCFFNFTWVLYDVYGLETRDNKSSFASSLALGNRDRKIRSHAIPWLAGERDVTNYPPFNELKNMLATMSNFYF